MLLTVAGVAMTVLHYRDRSRAARGRRELESRRGDTGATLVLRRGGSDEAGFLRRVRAKVDGEVVAMLAYRDEVTLHVAPGDYDVAAQSDWMHGGPLRVVLTEGETVTLRISISMTRGLTGFVRPREAIEVKPA